MTSAIRTRNRRSILIAEPQPVMRFGLAQLINQERDLLVTGEADTGAQALNLIAARRPDLLLLDVVLPDRNGLDLLRDVHVFHAGLPALVFSMYDEGIFAERVLRSGGRGYVMKTEPGRKLLLAIRQVLEGRIYVSERIASGILESFSGHPAQANGSLVQALSEREFEVFQLMGQGRATREIAERLHISVKTVEVHRGNIKRKLHLRTGAQLLHYAFQSQQGNKPARA